MYRLRKLRSFNVSPTILRMFYCSTVSSVLTFGATCWGGNITAQDKGRVDKIISKAEGVTGREEEHFDLVYHRRLTDKITTILTDNTHPLREEFDSRRIDKSGRLKLPIMRTERYRKSFIPRAVNLYKDLQRREMAGVCLLSLLCVFINLLFFFIPLFFLLI